MRKLVWLLVVYAAVLFLAAPRLPLWLDEVLTLVGSAQPSLPALLDYIRTVSGGSPLTFLGPRLAMQWFGANEIAARLPSILASLASAPALMLLARRAGASPILAVALFLSLPLQFRYALEARPYALALCLTAWLTVFFLERRLPWLYVLLAVAAAFTQPYAAFVVAGHFVWAVWEDPRRAWLPLIALSVSAAALLPWYLYYERYWRAVNQAQQIVTWDWRAPMVFVHEIGGSGYFGSGLLLAGAAIGWRQARDRFWLCCLFVPLAAAWAANVVFHYFFSVRQVIYVLPVLAVLFLAGTKSRGHAGQAMLAALLLASLIADGMWLRKPREDWKSAADAAAVHVEAGACMIFLGDSTPLYLYFHPELEQHRCAENASRVVVGVTPYFEDQSYPPAVAALESRGLHKQSVQQFDGPRVEVFAP